MQQTICGYRRLQAILALTLLAAPALASADVITIRQNLNKYWFYADRVRTQFLVPGTAAGNSIPACLRHDGQAFIKFADATIHLGWYIGALATEHYMISHPEIFPGYSAGNANALNEVRTELYQALNALNRVDAVAEASFNASAPDTSGFFIRDDVPTSMVAQFPGMTVLFSDFNDPVLTNKEESQDQVVHILLGLTLVKKLIPPGVIVNGMDLRQSAIDRGVAIVGWMDQGDWFIKNPVTGINVNRGDDARVFSTGFNKSVIYLTDGAVNYGSTLGFLWDTLSSPSNPAYDNRNNRHMAMSLAATGNGWGDSNTLNALMSIADAYDWYVYVLLYAALYDPIPQNRPTWLGHQATINNAVQPMLNLAPESGPHHPNNPGEFNTGWCCDHRWLSTTDGQNNGCDPGRTGQTYNGLDYLVVHNLYYIVTPSLWQDPTPPAIGLNIASINHQIEQGQSLPDGNFQVHNTTIGTLNYTIDDGATWLECSPTGGSSTGEQDSIAITYNTAGLAVGDYVADITITATDASNSPQTLTVSLTVDPIATVTPDFNLDRDVDQSDFAHLQLCFTGSGHPFAPSCANADLDADLDIDAADLTIFLNCLSGPNIPANLNCD